MAAYPIFWLWLFKEHVETQKLENVMSAIPLHTGHLILWHTDSFITKVLTVVKNKGGQISPFGLCNWHLLFLLPRIPVTPTCGKSEERPLLELGESIPVQGWSMCTGLSSSEPHIFLTTVIGWICYSSLSEPLKHDVSPELLQSP